MSDDKELRDLFREGRASDREAAPPFAQVWPTESETAANDDGLTRRGWVVAVAAVVLLGATFAWFDSGSPQPANPPLAMTQPQPDIPADSVDEELMELAAWEAEAFDSPTDYLLEQRGTLGGGIPNAFSDEVLEMDDLSMEL